MNNIKELINDYKKYKKEGYKTIQGDNEIISLKKKNKTEQLENSICEMARKHILKVKEISDKYHVDCEYSDSIRKDSGFWEYEIKLDYNNNFGEGEKHDWVLMTYEDHWSYGGKCHENESVTFDELINFNEQKFIEKCRQRKTKELKEKNSRLLKEIKDNEKQIQKIEDKQKR